MISIREARESDWPQIVGLLRAAALPTEDLAASMREDFLVAEMGADDRLQFVGLVGLQQMSRLGLVRSLVVAEACRGRGVGARLLAQIEQTAKATGIRELWLLTTDADRFFSVHGFTTADRASAPETIRHTDEFKSLCPGDAILMRKRVQ